MNAWDIFTWFCIVVLSVGSVLIFCLFAKDLGFVLKGGQGDGEQPPDK